MDLRVGLIKKAWRHPDAERWVGGWVACAFFAGPSSYLLAVGVLSV